MTTETNTPQHNSRFNHARKQWIKAVFWCLIYILFIIWLGNYWWLLVLPIIFDAFITKFIPWTWWKNSKSKTVRSIMSWVDAIVFALIAVYLINNYLFQNYQIPTSSLEKTLLVGDFLAVSKASYGPRVPMTPFSFPLVQNTFPIINTNSYLEKPQIKYRRLKGLREIKRNDIVVFNFPAGDTISFNVQNPDYYTNVYREGLAYVVGVLQQEPTAELCYSNGREIVHSKKDYYGETLYRPVDRRENYVKRCVGLPGDTLKIVNNQIYIDGKAQEKFPGIQFSYFIQTDGTRLSREAMSKLNISNEDFWEINNSQWYEQILKLGLNPNYPIYHFPLTEETYNKIQNVTGVTKLVIEPDWFFVFYKNTEDVYPLGGGTNWSRDNYGPIYIPKKGSTIALNPQTYPIYERCIRNFEGNKLEARNGQYFINDKPATSYTFRMDYYWMMGDNRHKSADSRSWGFVPEDHVVGSPMFVWLSLNKDKSLFGGKIRFDRFFKNASR
ncbi:MAG: S26 family signal peptidase [Porphyromonadaceae bacterium]|nr:S26 family signal peptidase [Porphyromonadaceae bacterium]